MEIEPEMGSILAFADVVSTSRMGKEAAQTTVTSLVSNWLRHASDRDHLHSQSVIAGDIRPANLHQGDDGVLFNVLHAYWLLFLPKIGGSFIPSNALAHVCYA